MTNRARPRYAMYVIAKANGLNLQFVGAEGKGRG
jgi:hypothetical protein